MERKFCVIGTGFVAARHFEAIHSVGGKVLDVVNSSGDWRLVLAKTKADWVSILTPNDLHVEMAAAARKLGKSVIVEKPTGISSRKVRDLHYMENMTPGNCYTVCQLRHHSGIPKLMERILPVKNTILVDVAVYRDDRYFNSWKGDDARSGGLLFNLGVHYLDIALLLGGPLVEIRAVEIVPTRAVGVFGTEKGEVTFRVEIVDDWTKQHRRIAVNGFPVSIDCGDSLANTGLHKVVYEQAMNSRGVRPGEALPVIELIEALGSFV